MNLSTILGRLRIAGIAEGVSCLLLFFVAMPLKYLRDEPLMTTIVGGIHGTLFLIYIALAIIAWRVRRWHWTRAMIAGIAAFVPFGTFVFDYSLKREQDAATRPAGYADGTPEGMS